LGKAKRKRTRIKKETEFLIDDDAYIQNSCSKSAKKIETTVFDSSLELWIDKHYSSRVQFGDDNGAREGIEIEDVQTLIKKAFRHLVYYSLKHKEFVFVNHPPQKTRNIRIVLKELFPMRSTLNVVVEFHFVSLELIEATVKTAMANENFDQSDGQYSIEFSDQESELKIFRRNTNSVISIDNYSE
jgi:hypothetical protein